MNSFLKDLEATLNDKIVSKNSLGGGCIGNAMQIKTKAGKNYFVKHYSNPAVHTAESNGLRELKKANAIRIPEVVAVSENYLCLEFLDTGRRKNNFSEELGRQFARLHKFNSDQYGFYENNFIGSTVQKNLPQSNNWAEFYFENRIMFQVNLAEKNGYLKAELREAVRLLENKFDVILDDCGEAPALLHGDLWGGNYLCDEYGNPCLIDPAVYYGNREADLAMTKIFGGFDSDFYRAYEAEFPLKDGWEYRENIYKLYHILNHLNLFGSGYYMQALGLVKSYL